MSSFWIDVYDAAGVKQNEHSFNVANVTLTERVSRIGQVSFTVPAAVLPELLPDFGKRYRLYSESNGYRGEFRHKSITIDADARTATISADDSLIALANQIVGFNRFYGAGSTVKSIIASLASSVSWSVSYEPGFIDEKITAEFQGESYLTALDTFRNYMRGWFRRESDTALRFGTFRNLGLHYTRYNNSTDGLYADTVTTALPSGSTITVESTEGFDDFGSLFAVANGVQVVYVSKTATTFTTAAPLSAYEIAAFSPIGSEVIRGTLTLYGNKKFKGQFGVVDPSEIDARVMNVPHASAATLRGGEFVGNTGATGGTPPPYTLITKLTQLVDGTPVVNRVYPLGSGQGIGVTRLDLRYSGMDGSPLPIQFLTNPDGSLRYYLEDTTSQAVYGVVERVLPFNDIRPITNSLPDLRAAADALYVMGLAYLRKFAYPYEVYSLSCIGLPEAAKVGSVITLEFRGVATKHKANGQEEEAWLHVDNAPFFILEKSTKYDEHGQPTYDLTVSSNGEGAVSSTDIFVNTLRDIEKFKARPTPVQTYYTKANPTLPLSLEPSISPSFGFVLGPEVLFVNDMVLEMRLSRLTSYSVTEIAPGAMVAEPPPEQEQTTDSGDLTSSGASTSTTTTDGGGASVSTATGGSSASHSHVIYINGGTIGSERQVYLEGTGNVALKVSGSAETLGTAEGGGQHSHSVNFSLGPHAHGMGHTHSMPSHSHRHVHTHPISSDALQTEYGVSSSPNLPGFVTVLLNGALITNWTLLSSFDSASTDGAYCHGDGIFRANITGMFPAINAQGTYELQFTCGAHEGLVFAQLLGRVTIQPIQVVT